MQTIYTPKGRAYEYAPLALNIYSGCSHHCTYCYMRPIHERFHGAGSFDTPMYREGLLEALRNKLVYDYMDLLGGRKYIGKTIHLCFSCDPYPADIDTTPTREVIKLLKEAGCHVQILTKSGRQADRDFDLLDSKDWYGVTYTGYAGDTLDFHTEYEPNAAVPADRLWILEAAHRKGISTWVSCEPVMDTEDVLNLIQNARYIDLFRVGKLNHFKSQADWAKFGHDVERVAAQFGRRVIIKHDLRAEMEASYGH